MKGRYVKGIFAILAVAMLLAAIGYFMQLTLLSSVYGASGQDISRLAADSRTPIRINEVMTRNRSAYLNALHAYTNWVELTNVSNRPINIGGYVLTKTRVSANRFVCPFVELQPDETLLIYCSGTQMNDPSRDLHAPFTLSSGDNTLFLATPSGDIADAVLVPPLGINQVYARDADTRVWSTTDFFTPGLPNTYQSHMAVIEQNRANRSTATLKISEILARNMSTITDEDNQYSGWVEIHNVGSRPVSLDGFALSNKSGKPMKWLFPKVTIAPDEYLSVYCSGKNRTPTDGAPLHTNFKLSPERDTILLSDNRGALIDQVSILNNKADRSFGRDTVGMWTVFEQPTPGMANTPDNAASMESALRNRNSTGLFLTEVMAAYNDPMDRIAGYDWVELHNTKAYPIELADYGLSDNQSIPRKWQFPPGASIAAGGYMVIRLTAYDRYSETTNAYHANFKLSNDGDESISLCNPDGRIIDRIPLPVQYLNTSYGRVDGRAGFFYLTHLSPGAANANTTFEGKVDDVIPSTRGGLIAAPATLKLTCLDDDAEIRYTLDCTEPNAGSALYNTAAIAIDKTTIVRAKAFKGGFMPSDTLTAGFYMGVSHTTPMIALVLNPADMYDNARGLFIKGAGTIANFNMNMEKPANMTYFDENGYAQVSQNLGIKIAGELSRTQDQKALMLTARKKYSRDRIPYNPFPNRAYQQYRAWVLRAGGQDAKRTHMRDILAASLIEGEPILTQDYRLTAVYINGAYFGQYEIRERINKYMVAQYLNAPYEYEHVNLLRVNGLVVSGTSADYRALIDFVDRNPLTQRLNLNYVLDRVDVESFFLYHIYSMYFGSMDMTNQKMFRLRGFIQKWRWAAFDFDDAFASPDYNNVSRNLNAMGIAVGNVTMDNKLLRALLEVPEMQDRFLTMFARVIKRADSAVMLDGIDRIASELAPDMPAQMMRFSGTIAAWQRAVNELRAFAEVRPGYVMAHLQAQFNLTDDSMARYFGG